MLAITDCKLWVMERAVYMAIKRTYQEQLAALKRKMVASVPILAVLSEVPLCLACHSSARHSHPSLTAHVRDAACKSACRSTCAHTQKLAVAGKVSALHWNGMSSASRPQQQRQGNQLPGTFACLQRAHAHVLRAHSSLGQGARLTRRVLQDNRELIASALEPVEFRAGQTIFRQGERGDRFYIIQEGAVVVSKTADGERSVLARLGEGAYFGERALIKDDVRQACLPRTDGQSGTTCAGTDSGMPRGVLPEWHA